MFSLESPQRGDSNEYTQYSIFNIKKKITLNIPNLQLWDFFSYELKHEFETAKVKEPSVLEPLKFCTFYLCFLIVSYDEGVATYAMLYTKTETENYFRPTLNQTPTQKQNHRTCL